MRGGHNKGVTKYKPNMERLAEELKKREMTFRECVIAAGVSDKIFLSLITLMTFEYPLYEYGKGAKKKYGILSV